MVILLHGENGIPRETAEKVESKASFQVADQKQRKRKPSAILVRHQWRGSAVLQTWTVDSDRNAVLKYLLIMCFFLVFFFYLGSMS
ncbi:hypothetical protein ACMD2_11901, partial [Ananas comosus]